MTEKELQPADLAAAYSKYIWAKDMQEGKFYRARTSVRLFKKEGGTIYAQSFRDKNDWFVVNPSPKSMFEEVTGGE